MNQDHIVDSKFITVYITKYALTKGIFECRVKECGNGMVVWSSEECGCYNQYFHTEGKEWHRTKESAIAKANKMRDQKILNLKKNIDKLNAKTFSI